METVLAVESWAAEIREAVDLEDGSFAQRKGTVG